MCRWLAYSGSPVLLEELLYKPKYSLIDQSRTPGWERRRRTVMDSASAGTEPRTRVAVGRVSEPLGDLVGAWNELPEASYGVIQPGRDELHAFTPTQAP